MTDHGLSPGDLLALVTAILGGVTVIGRLLLQVRDTLRDLRTAIGQEDPPAGLLGKVAEIETEIERTKTRVEEQREWIIAAGLHDRRSGVDDRRRRDHLTVRK
jgi:hypothetical protein